MEDYRRRQDVVCHTPIDGRGLSMVLQDREEPWHADVRAICRQNQPPVCAGPSTGQAKCSIRHCGTRGNCCDTSSPKGTSSGSRTWNRCPAGLRISAAGLCFHPGNPDLLATADPNSATVGVATFSTSIFTPCAITGEACCSVIAANNPGGASGYSSVRSLW